jgi:hypothetical protein
MSNAPASNESARIRGVMKGGAVRDAVAFRVETGELDAPLVDVHGRDVRAKRRADDRARADVASELEDVTVFQGRPDEGVAGVAAETPLTRYSCILTILHLQHCKL